MNLLEQTEHAIQTFYHCQNTTERDAAHHWLLELQKSSEGWQISWLLLNKQKTVEMQYYGANILHFKISKCMKDIAKDQWSDLKTRFLELLLLFCDGPKLIICKLCLGYSAFIIQVADEDFNLLECMKAIEKHFKAFNKEAKLIILELLNAFPNEFKALTLSPSQKVLVRSFMNNFKPTMLSMCQHVLEEKRVGDELDTKHKLDTLSCLLSWVEFGISLLDSIELLPILFSYVSEVDLSEKVCEVLIEFITSPTSYSVEATIFHVLQQCLHLSELVQNAFDEENHDLINSLCMIYTGIGETHCRLFLKTTENSKQMAMLNLVKLILKFTSIKGYYPIDETCSELTFNFWYTLQDDLYAIDIDDITDYQKQFTEAYVMLIDTFYNKCQFPPDSVYVKFSDDEKEKFHCYRIDIQDTMLYVFTLLQERCLVYFQEKLLMLLSDESSQWQQFEAVLYLLRGATDSIDTSESVYIPSILLLLTKLPTHPKIMNTLVLFVGALSEWLNAHPEQIDIVLPFLLKGIMIPETATSCSISLKDLCHECSLLLHESTIMEILQTCCKGLRSQTTPLKVVVRFFEIGGYVLSTLPSSQMMMKLEVLIAPLFQWFRTTLQQRTVTQKSKKKLVHYLNCFHGLFRALDPFEDQVVHPIEVIFGQLVPLFRFLKPWCIFEEVTTAATACISKALEISREKLCSHVNVISEVLVDFFTAQPFGCVLDTSATLIGMFGVEARYTERILNLFTLLTNSCVSMIESGDGKNHPDCMQSFMDLLTRVIKTIPEFLYNDPKQQILVLKCALTLITYQETPTIKSTCNFLIAYINYSNSYENGKEMMQEVGRDIVMQTFVCIGSVAPRRTTDHFAEIILAFSKNFVTFFALCLSDVFSKDGFPTNVVTTTQKEHFKSAVLRERVNKRRMKEIVKDFALMCRGLHGMSYVQ